MNVGKYDHCCKGNNYIMELRVLSHCMIFHQNASFNNTKIDYSNGIKTRTTISSKVNFVKRTMIPSFIIQSVQSELYTDMRK